MNTQHLSRGPNKVDSGSRETTEKLGTSPAQDSPTPLLPLGQYQQDARNKSDGQSLGESRVRIKFNVTSDSVIDDIKRRSADLIDLCAMIREGKLFNPERERLIALAATHYEDASMWAVKAVTL